MKKLVLAATALLGLGAPALAQTTFQEVDADGSGEVSYIELAVYVPDLTEAEYTRADADSSGGLSIEEINALLQGRQ